MSPLKHFSGVDGEGFLFWCPGCKEPHAIRVSGNPPTWGWNGNEEKPTFTPSVLLRVGHYAGQDLTTCWCAYNAEHPDEPSRYECHRCHSFVTDGRINFLGDSTHELAGQTVDLPPWKGWDGTGDER